MLVSSIALVGSASFRWINTFRSATPRRQQWMRWPICLSGLVLARRQSFIPEITARWTSSMRWLRSLRGKRQIMNTCWRWTQKSVSSTGFQALFLFFNRDPLWFWVPKTLEKHSVWTFGLGHSLFFGKKWRWARGFGWWRRWLRSSGKSCPARQCCIRQSWRCSKRYLEFSKKPIANECKSSHYVFFHFLFLFYNLFFSLWRWSFGMFPILGFVVPAVQTLNLKSLALRAKQSLERPFTFGHQIHRIHSNSDIAIATFPSHRNYTTSFDLKQNLQKNKNMKNMENLFRLDAKPQTLHYQPRT